MLELSSTAVPPGKVADPEKRATIHILLAAPRGFCAGVRRAIDAVRDALVTYGAPVYVRRPVVHNLEVVRALESEGAIFVEELDEVPAGAVVIFSAHGVSPAIAEDARTRGLISFDAVCPLVAKVHREVGRHVRDGRTVILVGHVGHPEIEGTLGYVGSGRAFVVRSVTEVDALPLQAEAPAAYAIQTTYSVDDARQIVEALRRRFRNLAEPGSSDICYATTNRQNSVRAIAERADTVIIVGESFSSNACRLAEVARESCAAVQLIAGPTEIDWELVPAGGLIGISAAASTPERSVQSVIAALGERFDLKVGELELTREAATFKRLELV